MKLCESFDNIYTFAYLFKKNNKDSCVGKVCKQRSAYISQKCKEIGKEKFSVSKSHYFLLSIRHCFYVIVNEHKSDS